jgi:hypothetical protein
MDQPTWSLVQAGVGSTRRRQQPLKTLPDQVVPDTGRRCRGRCRGGARSPRCSPCRPRLPRMPRSRSECPCGPPVWPWLIKPQPLRCPTGPITSVSGRSCHSTSSSTEYRRLLTVPDGLAAWISQGESAELWRPRVTVDRLVASRGPSARDPAPGLERPARLPPRCPRRVVRSCHEQRVANARADAP